MSFFDFLDKIRSKPPHIRSQIMWFCVAVLMLVITFFWVVSFKHSIELIENGERPEKELSQSLDQVKKEAPSLLGEIKSIFSTFLQDLKRDNKQKQESEEDEKDREIQELETLDKQDNYEPAKLPLRF